MNERVRGVGRMILTGETEILGEKYYTAWVVMNEWAWNNGGMILTGENLSTERKTLYSVGGR